MEDYETKITTYAEKIIKLTAAIEKMEKNPDSYNDADLDDKKVEIKQVEALVKELQGSVSGSKTVFQTLRVQVGPADVGPNQSKVRARGKALLFSGFITRRDPDQTGEDLRQEHGSAGTPGVHQGAAAT